MGDKILKKARKKIKKIIEENNLENKKIEVFFRTLKSEEAIGKPSRSDYPIVKGKEKVIEAELAGVKAHVFTESPLDFTGSVEEAMNLPLESSRNRAVFIAAMNAILKKAGKIEKALHCRDEEPQKCAEEISVHIRKKYGKVKVGLIGFNPAILEELSQVFGAENVKLTDLDRENIGRAKYGVKVMDGTRYTEKLVKESDLVLLTGTTLVNGTFDDIFDLVKRYKKDYIIYGVTSAGVCALLNLERVCFFGRDSL